MDFKYSQILRYCIDIDIENIDIENGRLHQLQTVFQQCPKQITYIYTIADYSRQSFCEVEIVVRGPNRNEQGCILQA